ncbi:MAG: hypothetical protein R3B06_12510 [Kofleriaceae bacterium]
MTVSPPGMPPFELWGIGMMARVELGGQDDGAVMISAPLAFSARISTRTFHAARSADLQGGLLHLGAGQFLHDVRTDGGTGAIATIPLGDELEAEVVGAEVSCDLLALDDDGADAEGAPSGPPASRLSRWGPRHDSVAFQAKPGAGPSLLVSFPGRRNGAFREIERRGRFHRLIVGDDAQWVVGWVDESNLVRAKPGNRIQSVLYGFGQPAAPPGGFSGPRRVKGGTVVFGAAGGIGQWAVVPVDAVFDVVSEKDARWVELTGTIRAGISTRLFSDDLRGHAWIAADAVAPFEPPPTARRPS